MQPESSVALEAYLGETRSPIVVFIVNHSGHKQYILVHAGTVGQAF